MKNRLNEDAVSIRPKRIIKAGNSKVSEYVAVVNMPPHFTCPADAPCRKDCYACKGRYCFNNVNLPQWQNFKWFVDNSTEFFQKIVDELTEADNLRPWKRFRWHETGDIVNAEYFENMVVIARLFPRIQFMAFTKKYAIVNNWIDNNGKLPKNLNIIFSNWGLYGAGMNKHNLPCTYVHGVENDENIPASAQKCEGSCKDCNFKCWTLKKRQSVVFEKH